MSLEEMLAVKAPKQKGHSVRQYHQALAMQRENKTRAEIGEALGFEGKQSSIEHRVDVYLAHARDLEAKAMAARNNPSL